MPNLGADEDPVQFTFVENRVPIGGSTIQDLEGQNIVEKQTYIELTITQHTFKDGKTANAYRIYEKQRLLHTVSTAGTYIISRKFANNSNSLTTYGFDDSVFIDIVAVNVSENKYSKPSCSCPIATARGGSNCCARSFSA